MIMKPPLLNISSAHNDEHFVNLYENTNIKENLHQSSSHDLLYFCLDRVAYNI